jgi:hypothetical protein
MRLCITVSALAAMLLAVGGCGGSQSAVTTSSTGVFPQSVADDLASKSEAIADAWDAGDKCGAAHQADDLAHAVDKAVSEGQIPAAYRSELETAVTTLQSSVNCEPEKHQNEGDENGDGEKKGHDKNGDGIAITTNGTTTVGTTTGTTTDTTTGTATRTIAGDLD